MVSFNEYGCLPAGIHPFTVTQFKKTFGFTAKRKEMIEKGLKPVLTELVAFKVKEVYIDGSFVTVAGNPDDIDGYTLTEVGGDLHAFIIERQEGWQLYCRVDFHAALTDIEGEGSAAWFEGHFSTVFDRPSIKKGYVALNLSESREI